MITMTTLTKKDIFQNEELVTVQATFSKNALKNIRDFYQTGIKHKKWNLTEDEFLGWMAAHGTLTMIKGETEKTVKGNEKTKSKSGCK